MASSVGSSQEQGDSSPHWQTIEAGDDELHLHRCARRLAALYPARYDFRVIGLTPSGTRFELQVRHC